jgi:hypothetical protein
LLDRIKDGRRIQGFASSELESAYFFFGFLTLRTARPSDARAQD